MNRDALRCLIIDDHPVVRQGIRALLEREIDSVVVTDAATPAAALGAAGEDSPDVVIVDPRGAGLEVGSLVQDLNRELGSAIVVFTSNGGARLLSESLKAGLKGYVRKDSPPEDLVRAIRAARTRSSGGDPLRTDRKSTSLNASHQIISYAVVRLNKKKRGDRELA